jgi:hypothetical protein
MYKLQDVVSEWIIENGKNESQRPRLYTIALSGLRELHLDVNGIVKIVELPINENDTVDLPLDFVNYSKIAISGDDGRVYTLGRDNTINLNPSCGTQGRIVGSAEADGPFAGYPFTGYFYGVNGFAGGAFGLGGGNNQYGYYRLKRETNQLWLTNLSLPSSCYIILEYIADINSDGEDFIVHPYIIQTIKDWISWKYVTGDRNTNLGEKQLRQKNFYNSLRISKNRYGSSTPEEWAMELRKTNTASVRF